ncbi:hypothetical protein [Acetobacter aceti]|uniref:hypothetical protein n=1 Tax=Acetobacter aceti TaxID=435 RepID=UPI001CA3A574|nr:hypothetical protein [Acetobacter aceti]
MVRLVRGQSRGSRLDGHEAFIVGMIEAQKDITLNEMVVLIRCRAREKPSNERARR